MHRQVRRTQRRIGYEESADARTIMPIASLSASRHDRSRSMRAIQLIRATLAAALFAGATLTAACAVEDEAVVDDDALLDDVAADVKGEELADKALTVGLSVSQRCVGSSTEYTLMGTANTTGVSYTYYQRTSSGTWQVIGSGAIDIVNITGSSRTFKARGCKGGACDDSSPVTRNSSCNQPGNPGNPGDPQDPR
jgi:hypothetical protein